MLGGSWLVISRVLRARGAIIWVTLLVTLPRTTPQ